jgi:hypothetical protein
VNVATGSDYLDGLFSSVQGKIHGPKKSINSAIKKARQGDMIIVETGVYYEDVELPDGVGMIVSGVGSMELRKKCAFDVGWN